MLDRFSDSNENGYKDKAGNLVQSGMTPLYTFIDNELHKAGDALKCVYSTDAAQIGQSVAVEARNGKAVLVTVPASGFVIFE